MLPLKLYLDVQLKFCGKIIKKRVGGNWRSGVTTLVELRHYEQGI